MSAMTEDEARKKWCPFARCQSHPYETAEGTVRVSVTTNREPMHFRETNVTVDTALNCIAFECMAWRWIDPEFENERTERNGDEDADPPRPDGDGWVEHSIGLGLDLSGRNSGQRYRSWDWRRPTPGRRGYCGLAGKP